MRSNQETARSLYREIIYSDEGSEQTASWLELLDLREYSIVPLTDEDIEYIDRLIHDLEMSGFADY